MKTNLYTSGSLKYYGNKFLITCCLFFSLIGFSGNASALPVHNISTGQDYTTIQDAVNAVLTVDGNIITVDPGTYNEQVLINKQLTIKRSGVTKPVIDYTGLPALGSGKLTIFEITVPNVMIEGFEFHVNVTNLGSAIVASGALLNNIYVKDNDIIPYRSALTTVSFGLRNAISINYGIYRINSTNPFVVIQGNLISWNAGADFTLGTSDDANFRAGISADEAGGTFTLNTIQSVSQDIEARFGGAGDIFVTSNNIIGGGVELSDFNAGAGNISVIGNTFNGAIAAGYSSSLRLKDNNSNKATLVQSNTFTTHNWGISLENFRNVTILNNSFTPFPGSTNYRHITINTKAITTSSSTVAQIPVDATILANNFNGSGVTGGYGLAFFNHDDDADSYGTFTIGSPGSENTFDQGIGKFIFFDTQSGSSTGSIFPPYNVILGISPGATTNMAYWATNIDASNNKYNVGSGFELPSAMSLANLFKLEDKIQHATDAGGLGFVTVKANNDYITINSFASPVTSAALIQRGVDAASNGFTVNVNSGTFSENLLINKEVNVRGANADVSCYTGGRGAESVISSTGGSGTIAVNILSDNVTLNGFTITNPAGSFGVYEKGFSNVTVNYNIITNIGNSTTGSIATYGVAVEMGSAADMSDVLISDNCVNNIRGGQNTSLTGAAAKANNGSGVGIGAGFSTANQNITGLSIIRNKINAITASIADFADGGKGAYGIIINVGANVANNGKAISPLVRENEITTLEGLWAHGVGLEGETPGAQVLNNTISGLVDHKAGTDAIGVLLEDNAGASTVSIKENSFTSMALALKNLMVPAVDATCNWYGSNVLATVASKINGPFIYTPYLVIGTDNSAGIGFQPLPGCIAPCALILTPSSTDATCPLNNNGTASVSVSGGVGPYSYLWSPGGAVTESISGLTAGNYDVTVTDVNGCTSSVTIPVANSSAGPVHNINTGFNYCTIQAAIDAPMTIGGHSITVDPGTYIEDVSVTKSLKISGAGFSSTTVSGPIGGGGSTFQVLAGGVIIEGFTITREGNNTTDWNGALNLAGVAVQGLTNSVELRLCKITGNRNGVDVNNSNGNNIHNNIIDFNRTGLIFRNQTDNTQLTENFITNNWTMGVLFLDASVGSNVPVQTAINSNFNNNDISGNWYGDIVDRQTGGALPPPGANPKNFTCNWYGVIPPTTSTANSTEPGYAAQIPVAYGGSAVPPGGQPNILGPASANFDYIPFLISGTDVGGNPNDGFQPVAGCLAPCALVLSSSSTPSACPALVSGTATVNVTGGGVGPYTYSWSPGGAVTQTATGLAPGTYTVTVTDINGCTATTTATVGISGPVHNLTTGIDYCTIQSAINAASNGDIILADAGTYNENVVLNKSIVLTGAQNGVNACGRSASESIISGAGTLLVLNTGCAGAVIDGFTFSGGIRSIESTSGPLNNLIIKNNRFIGFTGNAIFLNDNGTDITLDQNSVDGTSKAGAGDLIHLDTDGFNGFYLTNNCITNGPTATGFFVDGNHNVAPSANRSPLISGNTITFCATGANLGTRAFGSFTLTNAGAITRNDFSNNTFDGLQGGMQHVLINENTFSNNGRSGLALTSFGNTGADRGAQNSTIRNNFFFGNVREDLFISSTQAAGTQATNVVHENSLLSTMAITYNGTEVVDATCNWFGSTSPAVIATKITNPAGNLIETPWLLSGVDTDLPTPGFQPAAGCVAPCALVLSSSSTFANCPSQNDGTASVSVTGGGTGPYTYSWSPGGGTTQTITGLTAGNYIATVTDVNGCTASTTVAVSNNPAGPVHNLTTGLNYCTIQAAIDAAPTSNGDIISVDPGNYIENLIINKELTIQGPNANVSCYDGTRGPEAFIVSNAPSGSVAVHIQANNVTLNGFTITNPNGSFGVYEKGYSNINIRYNIISNIGNNVNGFGASYGVSIEMGSAGNIVNVNITDNCISNIRGGQNVSLTGTAAKNNNGSAVAIGAGFSTASFSISGLNILRNQINFMTASIDPFADGGKGAYGILINVGASAGGVGIAQSPLVQDNEITNLIGLWAHGIGLEGETPGASVLNNKINQLTDNKGGTDAVGVQVEDNAGAASVGIHENSFTNSALGLQNVTGTSVNATCNWYSVATPGGVAAKIAGPFTYVPYLLVGTDISATIGFQPVAGCVAPCALVLNPSSTPASCPAFNNGTASVDVTSGGSGTYTYLWSPGGQTTSTATGLVSGNYTVTVTDINGCTASTTIAVGTTYLPPAKPADVTTNVECVPASVTPPAVSDVCGNPITPSGPVSSGSYAGCEGTLILTYTYTDIYGGSTTWVRTFNVDHVTPPAEVGGPVSVAQTVQCESAATAPGTLPVVKDVCGTIIPAPAPVISNTPDPVTCEGTRVYTYTYLDCSGLPFVWTYTYTIDHTTAPVVPADGSSTVECESVATAPAPPVVQDACGTNVPAVLFNTTVSNTHTKSFNYTGTPQTFVVPPGVTSLNIKAFGAQGGNGSSSIAASGFTGLGGLGGSAEGNLAVVPGSTITIFVGGKGADGNAIVDATSAGGFNGGGAGGFDNNASLVNNGGGGGGASDVRLGAAGLADRVIVAAGGGGASGGKNPLAPISGGDGGALTGENGDNDDALGIGGTGGTQIGGGVAFSLLRGATNGSLGSGGNGSTNQNAYGSGGAGGGYYGGGGGTSTQDHGDGNGGGGGGGSSYLGGVTAGATTQGVRTGDGQVIITWESAGCAASKTYTYTYTDCSGLSSQWNYVYTIDRTTAPSEFGGPVANASTVECVSDAVVPSVLPVVHDACGNTLSPSSGTGPVFTPVTPGACEGTVVYTFTYTDCVGLEFTWTYTYTVDRTTSPAEAGGPVPVASTIQCVSDATAPALPVVKDVCGVTLPAPAPVITNVPDPVTCEGTRTYQYTYTDCAGLSFVWTYTYTIDHTIAPAEVGGPVATGSTVECISSATPPVNLPVVKDACGTTIPAPAPVITNSPDPVTCEGTRTYTYTYTDCSGLSLVWTYTYTIDHTIPPSQIGGPVPVASTVECPVSATPPLVLPVVKDVCGNVIPAPAPIVSNTPDPVTCEGIRTYTYTYLDCSGLTYAWVYTYTIDHTTSPVVPVPNGSATVESVALATPPIIQPAVVDVCGNPVTPVLQSVSDSPDPLICSGTRTYTYRYTDCSGATAFWTYTYTIDKDDKNVCTIDACDPFTGNVTHTPVDRNDNNPCTIDLCDQVLGVYHIPVNTNDFNPCTVDECNSVTGIITHTPLNVDDGNACTTDACNSVTGQITHTPANVSDGNACTVDGCDTNGNITHTAVVVDDGNACTTDACNTVTGAITHAAINTDDGNGCTIDACNTTNGNISHTNVSVDDGNGCTTDACNTLNGDITHVAVNTSDGNACTVDVCNTSTGIISHNAIPVDDGNACTTDACNSLNGDITHVALNTDDGNACTVDVCNTGTGIISHNAVPVDDGNACTTDACNSLNGDITHVAVNTDDNNPCTNDVCNTSTGIITHPAVNTDDGNPCTTDACNSTTGQITHIPVPVDDNNPCTIDACNTLGIVTHTNINVDDGNACTTDACNTVTGSVTHIPVNTDDGNACTNDACNTSSGAISHLPINTDDGNPCTIDGCNTATGATHTPKPVDDGNACTIDLCDAATGNIIHTTIDSDDNNPCTADACNTLTGAITHTPVPVDDGNACTNDGCNSITGIFHNPVPVDDNNVCTTDACNTLSGAVSHTNIATDDNNVCTTDGCNSVTGVFHNPISSDDGNPCTTDGCDALNGPYHLPVNVDDADACTIDACNTTTGVISHTALNVDDGNACTIDGCDKVTGPFHTPVNIDDGNACTIDGCDVIAGITHLPVNIDDFNNCTIDACNTLTGAITHTDQSPTVTATSGTISCYGGTTCVTVSAVGGLPPYTGTGVLCGYGAGSFSFDVTDARGCNVSSPVINITEPAKLITAVSSTPAGCVINDGTATATPSGGTPGYSYEWTPGGQTTNPATGLAPGNYSVKVTDANGCTVVGNVVVSSSGIAPGPLGPISGPSGACKKQSGVVYCVTPDPNATSYFWTLPAGVTAIGATNGPCITVKFSSKFKGGFICVRADNPCGSSANVCMNVVLIGAAPATPASITGNSNICPLTNVSYSIAPVLNASSYAWTANNGMIIISGQGTTSIVVSVPAGFSNGTISVKAVNCKGKSGSKSKNVVKDPGCRISNRSVTVTESNVSEPLTSLNAYPNPTSGKLTITFDSERNAKYSLKIVNILGSIMIDETINGVEGYNMKQINLENVAKGLYFISIQTEGAEAKTLRLIVE